MAVLAIAPRLVALEPVISDDAPLEMPQPGAHKLRILAPDLLELTLITTKKSQDSPPTQWDFIGDQKRLHAPATNAFQVIADGKAVPVLKVGFKRRVLYAPLKQRDLRIGNYLYLQLDGPIANNQSVEVRTADPKLWPATTQFLAVAKPLRWSPAIHVNQTGYLPSLPKVAMVGYYLGSLGEMDLEQALDGKNRPVQIGFQIIDSASDKAVFQGKLTLRGETGFPFAGYQRVFAADFSAFKQPGEYRLSVPGLGSSFPFFISDDVAGAFARAYALGIYHQRCGTANKLPFTRFVHGLCHVAPAEVPTMSASYESVNDVLAKETRDARENPRHTAPPLKNVAASLYPFMNKGPVDVRGGHHDAGDYSKYTANSAAFIHILVFAADNFPGVADLDNLGIPESGDGRSDILQEAKWEADFLAKMQDDDGGFYFLVYPRDRRYENDVTPDHGDPQVVFPKTTAATAAATAALVQCASSPAFRRQFPEAAKQYLEKARRGWDFLERAIATHGKDGAYQKITHYGNEFMHDDELAWAACEMFLATGDGRFHAKLSEWLNPADSGIRKWGWWRLFECYGNAIRDYAFAARNGRVKREQLDPRLLELCENEIISAGEDQLRRSEDSAYGVSFPSETKRTRSAGWFFAGDAAFDLAVASQLDYPIMNDPQPKLLAAILSNLNFESGCNPVNVSYLTGLGWKREREIVHQYALNDRRVLPPSGIPIGNIQDGFGWLDNYGEELGALTFPPDDDDFAPYPFYDRWGDSFNLKTEFVIPNQAHALGYLAWLMAKTPLKDQKWKASPAQINGVAATVLANQRITATLTASGLDLSRARTVWEFNGEEPVFGAAFQFTPAKTGRAWLEAEAQLPDGRRVYGVVDFNVR